MVNDATQPQYLCTSSCAAYITQSVKVTIGEKEETITYKRVVIDVEEEMETKKCNLTETNINYFFQKNDGEDAYECVEECSNGIRLY